MAGLAAKELDLLPVGKPTQGLWQCPHCENVVDPYPSKGTRDENGRRVMRWQCTKCEKYFRKQTLAPDIPPAA